MSTPEKPQSKVASGEVEEVKESPGPTIVDPSAMFAPQGEGKGPWYAWTRFIAQRDEESGIVRKWIEPGDKITAGDLELDDEEFQALIDSGAVREQEWPVPKGGVESPNEWYKKQMAIAAGEEVT